MLCSCFVAAAAFTPLAKADDVESLSFNDFSDVSGWQFNGVAAQQNDRLRLTPSAFIQAGTSFYHEPVLFPDDYSFRAHFAIEITDPASNNDDSVQDVDGTGGDGMAFVIQTDYRGPFAAGGAGGDMGFRGISPHVSVAFDAWHWGAYDLPGNPGYNGNHIEIDTSDAALSVAQTGPLPRFQDAGIIDVWIEYDGSTQIMNIYHVATDTGGADQPAQPTLSSMVDLGAVFGNATELYVGFAAGTWAAIETHEVLEFHLGEQAPATEPPTAVCQDWTAAADDECQGCAQAADLGADSFDPDGGDVWFDISPVGPFALGTTEVTLTVTDEDGESATCTSTVTVFDGPDTPPAIQCPEDIVVWPSSPDGAEVTFETTAEDNCDPSPQVLCSQTSGSNFGIGTTLIGCTAVDASGNEQSCSFEFSVLTVDDALDELMQVIDDFVNEQLLGHGQGNALISKLEAVARSCGRGQYGACCNQLEAFINQVQALLESGSLDADDGEYLLDLAGRIMAAAGCSS